MNNFLTAATFSSGGNWSLTSLINFFTSLVGLTIPIAVALCLFFFFWGIVQVFFDVEDAKKRDEGRKKIVWGLIALFVVVSLSGIIAILKQSILGGGR